MQKYIRIDHTADIGIDVFGSTLHELFSHAGFALFDIITDVSKVEGRIVREIIITGVDLEQLLVDWLGELLYIHDVENFLFSKFHVINIRDDQMKAFVMGERFQESKHIIKTEIKAVTHHNLSIVKEGSYWKARIIFDL